MDSRQRLRLGLRLFIISAGIIVAMAAANFYFAATTPGPNYQTHDWGDQGVTVEGASGRREPITFKSAERGDAWDLWYSPLPAVLWGFTILGMASCFRNFSSSALPGATSIFALMTMTYAVVRGSSVLGPWIYSGACLAACTIGCFAAYLHHLNGLHLHAHLARRGNGLSMVAGMGCVLPFLLAMVFSRLFPAEELAPDLLLLAPMSTLYLYATALAVRLLAATAVQKAQLEDESSSPAIEGSSTAQSE